MAIDNTPMLEVVQKVLEAGQVCVNALEKLGNSTTPLSNESVAGIIQGSISIISVQSDLIKRLLEENLQLTDGIEDAIRKHSKQ